MRHHLLIALLTALTTIAADGSTKAQEALRCAPFGQEDSPAPTPRGDLHALDRLERINHAVQSALHSVLFFGDSLTEGWDPAVWEQNMAPRGVLNAGISGDRTDHLLWRLQNGNLAGPPPKATIVLIGTNDLGSGRSPTLAADGIRATLQTLRQRLPESRILLLGLLPRGELPSDRLRLEVAQVNRLMRDCADGEHIFYSDLGSVLLDADGRLSSEISPDRLHFSAHGYSLLTLRLAPILDSVLGCQ